MIRRSEMWRIKNVPVLIGIVLLCAAPAVGGGQDSLTLEECVLKALENNLRVAVEEYNPQLAEALVTRAKETFMPRFDLTMGRQKTESPSYWWLQGEENQVSRYNDYSVAVIQQIPTGGNFQVSMNSYKSDTNQAFQLLNPRYGSTFRLDFSQPLLKDFGTKVSRQEILVARNNLDISQAQFKVVLQDTIYQVQEAYWNLVYAIEDYKVKQQSLQLGKDLLAKNRREVEVGKLAPIEILNAETVVAQREADIVQAESLIRKNEDSLKTILNIMGEEDASAAGILPADKPEFFKKEIDRQEMIRAALASRPDILISRRGMENKDINFAIAKNQLLPGLDLQLSYWSPGISGDRLLYLDDNPFSGVIVGTEPGGVGDSLGDALKLLYHNWSIGLTLSIPLSSLTTRAEYARTRLELEKSRVEMENTRQQILLEVRDAIRDVETNAKRVEAYKLARQLAERRLAAEVRKLDVGLTTNYFVLQYQEELATAQSQELRALVDYNLALGRLDRATGQSLEKRNISVQ
jgi:outer membrane protein TolC